MTALRPSADADTLDSLRAAMLAQQLRAMSDRLDAQDRKIALLEEERRNLLKWGVIALGTGLAGVVSWIVNLFAGGHVK